MADQHHKSVLEESDDDRILAKWRRNFYQRRFLVLLIAQILLVVVAPLMQGLPIAQTMLQVLTSMVLLAAILAVSDSRKLLLIAICLAIPALIVTWLQRFLQSDALTVTGHGIEFLFFGYTSFHIVFRVFHGANVNSDRLFGAIAAYMLIGVTWAMLYVVLETAHTGSFRFGGASELLNGQSQEAQRTSNLLYYSFVTISTLGYGDIVPVSRAAQTFSWLEAVVGQLFLAVLVARLVGLYIVAETKPRARPDPPERNAP